jgi:hypothetical protein
LLQLERLQADFLAAIRQQRDGFERAIVDGAPPGAGERLAVYRHAYNARLLEALGDAYPALHTLLGDQRFERLGVAYIDAQPSRHFSIRWFGHRLREFIDASEDDKTRPFLAEMAAFEWALRDTFDAADAPTLSVQALQAIAVDEWPGLRLHFHASLRRLDLAWNTPLLWDAIDKDAEPAAPQRNPYPIAWLLWRHDLLTHYRSLEVDEAWALDQAAAGEGFGELCAGLVEWVDEQQAAQRAAALLSRWMQEGLVIGVD